jgi:8-oxo-dGTP diphosphatase
VEFGESPEECVVREFAEESGLDVEVGEVRAVVSDVADVYEESVRFHSVRLIYGVDGADQPLRAETDGSTDAAHWVPDRDVPALNLPEWLLRWLPPALL